MTGEQQTLVDKADVLPGLKGKTVWVVSGIFVDSPYPEPLGVFDTPEDAEALEKEIKKARGHWDGWDLATWQTHEIEIGDGGVAGP